MVKSREDIVSGTKDCIKMIKSINRLGLRILKTSGSESFYANTDPAVLYRIKLRNKAAERYLNEEATINTPVKDFQRRGSRRASLLLAPQSAQLLRRRSSLLTNLKPLTLPES